MVDHHEEPCEDAEEGFWKVVVVEVGVPEIDHIEKFSDHVLYLVEQSPAIDWRNVRVDLGESWIGLAYYGLIKFLVFIE